MSDETPEPVHRLRRAISRTLRRFATTISDEPPYHASWEMTFAVQTERDELDGGWVAECLDLPGCMSQGDTEAEALANLEDAIEAVVLTRIEERFNVAERRRARRAQQRSRQSHTQERTVNVKLAVNA